MENEENKLTKIYVKKGINGMSFFKERKKIIF